MSRERHEQHYEKRVDYIAKDEESQVATGVVMVPNTVDHQGDFERPDTIDAFANQFGAFMDADQADGGIIHAVWPSEWMSLERNEILTEAEEIGATTVDAGSWVQSWEYNDDDLWGLVEDDILGGHSIGAKAVEWDFVGEEPEDLPDDVTVPDEVDVSEYWELTDGIVQEVSAVDFPAVPDAQILTASKARAATAEKRFADHVGNPEGFIEEAMERGHSEEAAERMWSVVDRAINVEGSGSPGTKATLTDAAAAFLNKLIGADDGHTATSPEGPGSDRQTAKNAPEGDTSETGGTDAADDTDTDMSDDNPDDGGGDKSLAEQNAEQITELTQAVEDLTDAVTDDEEKAVTIKAGGEVHEVTESEAKAWFDDDDGGDGNSHRGEDYWVRLNNGGVSELYLDVHSLDDDIASLSNAVYVDFDYGRAGIPRNVRRAVAFRAGADLVEEAVVEIPQNATIYNIETKAEELRTQSERLLEVEG